MTLKHFKKINFEDERLNRWQDNEDVVFTQLLANPLAEAQLIPNVTLVAGNNQVSHKLGRKVVGVIPVNRNNAATIYTVPATPATPEDRIITLNASVACVVTLLVF